MRFAVIDMGTNTFNLLILEKSEEATRIVFKTKRPVKLGEGLAITGKLSNEAMNRGYLAIQQHLELIKQYEATQIYAFATSAIRSASNGTEYVEKIYSGYGINVNIISGDREAELIYYGIRQAVDLGEEKNLLVDIGGGSIEILIANKDEIFWKQSFNLGIARLLDIFSPSDPITNEEIIAAEKYIEEKTLSLNDAILKHPVSTLVGSSGSFDTFARMISQKFRPAGYLDNKISFEINLAEYYILHKELIESTIEERKKMQGLALMRVEMIVLASIFVNYIIKKYNIKKLIQSDYALKEGVISTI